MNNLLNHPDIKVEREKFNSDKEWLSYQEHVELCWEYMSQEEKDFIEASVNAHKEEAQQYLNHMGKVLLK